MFNKLPTTLTWKWNQCSQNGSVGWARAGGGSSFAFTLNAFQRGSRAFQIQWFCLNSEFQEELTSELDNKTINPSSLSEPMGGAQGQVSHMVVSWLLWKIPSAGPETHSNHSVSPLCPSYQVTIIKPCMEHTGHRDTWILVKDVRARIDEIVRGLRKPTGNMITPRPPPLLFFCPLFSVCLFLLKYNMSKY